MLTLELRRRLVVVTTRFLSLCAVLLTLLVPTTAFAFEAIAVSPLLGPAGRTVTVYGTGWRGHGVRGLSVPIWIGFANEVARGHPDANGEFSVSFTIPPSTPQGTLTITAITGYGDGRDTFYIVSDTQPADCFDAYFIGLHGSSEGPDGSGSFPDSPTIVETRNSFEALAMEAGKLVHSELLLYVAPDWNSLLDLVHEAVFYKDAGRDELHRHIQTVLGRCPTQGFVLVGYSFGAWIIDDWLSRNSSLWPNILAVELYGDPLWYRLYDATLFYGGWARRLGQAGKLDPYKEKLNLADRWQSRCLHGDAICGEGYSSPSFPIAEALQCKDTLCEHRKYPLDPEINMSLSGYGRTRHGAEFLAWKAFPSGAVGPEIVQVETFREGDLVFFRLFYTDPNNEIGGFGFVGINGSGWAEENHPFSSPSYGRVSPGRIEYPFNHLCETGPAYESDVETWILDNTGQRRSSVTVHLACAAPREVVIGPDPP
jgi:hypothetical protein